MWLVWCTCCTQPAFCHFTIDGIGNDLCSRRRSLFSLKTAPSIAQLKSFGAQLFHFSTTWWIVSISCLLPISLWKAPFWPWHRWAADKLPDWVLPWLGSTRKKWFTLRSSGIFVGCWFIANLSELLSNGIILIWSLPLWDTIQWHAQPILWL